MYWQSWRVWSELALDQINDLKILIDYQRAMECICWLEMWNLEYSKLRFLSVSKLSILCATNSFLLLVIGRRIGKFKFANCVCNFLTLQSVQIAKIGSAAVVAHHPIILLKNHPFSISCISLLFHNNNLQFNILHFFCVINAAKQHQWHNAINWLFSVIYAFAISEGGFATLQIA